MEAAKQGPISRGKKQLNTHACIRITPLSSPSGSRRTLVLDIALG